MSTTSRRWRTAMVATVAAMVMPLSGLAAAPAGANPTAGDGLTKIEQKVRDQIAAKGTTSFWVVLDSDADLSGADRLTRKVDKGRYVLTTKTRHAERTQAGLKALLDRHGAEYKSYWIDNSMFVTGDANLLAKIAARPEVEAIEADEALRLPDPIPGADEPSINAVEWNISRINAPQVWGMGIRGEGIVVANIDTGVQFDHPAVANTYRGKNADGTVNHNYNWHDPAAICTGGVMCDNNGHGTHTMGTMVGDDGAGNQIGVAPGAKWIAAKGCESSSCSRNSLLSSGQWMVAPTDLAGQNPRPDLAPDVVNNSWGGSGLDTWYAQTVQSWISAGIFPAFSNGNSGPSCNTSGSPGTYVISYSAGAFDINNAIASFSSRGPGENGDIKPNIAAPGVNVRSSVPTNTYASYSGTSMASPHLAATVALMWSASPAIQGDIAATRQILDDTAIDTNDTTCGGTADDNNVWGEGRLDAYAAVLATPRGALGTLRGTVTSGGAALAGATVSVSGPQSRSTTTAADGTYSFDRLMVGNYTVTVSKFGYQTASGPATVSENQTTIANFSLTASPSSVLSGTVTLSDGSPAGGATVAALGTPVSTTANAQGQYSMTLPHGTYQIQATHSNRCASPTTVTVTISANTVQNITLALKSDSFGYKCTAPTLPYTAGTTLVSLTGDDVVTTVSLPFTVSLYGTSYTSASISSNGWMSLATTTSSPYSNTTIPNTAVPNAAIYPFWDDLYLDASAGVYTGTTGTAPNRVFTVEWRNITFYSDRTARVSFVAMITESGQITFRYTGVDGGLDTGTSATTGIENGAGNVAFQYSFNEGVVSNGGGVTFRL